ncbi:beta strand repeat-containing protein [Anabaenopsis elenkinii]|uniref:Uncharacterized protein n=1 Tax=Anabaenopsis elenkinii CCIBt3563 TaxID=2779889 RepID=A0A7S6U097_9CYAN|nr:hypothetical protein [Anabaenopsis elenkinii]QOV24150.1 hypothetical protein IM676_07855 [Anabaenopsis elenkinii CCIBt3563]
MAIGAALISNLVNSQAQAYIDYSTTTPGVVTVGGDISITAKDTAGIEATSTIVSKSVTTNDGGLGIIQNYLNYLDDYEYTTASGTKLLIPLINKVRLAADYSRGGDGGSVYRFLGTDLDLIVDLGTEDYTNTSRWQKITQETADYVPNIGNISDSDAKAVGAMVVRNDVRSQVGSWINKAQITADSISIKAEESAIITANTESEITASGGSFYGSGTVVAGGGIAVTNLVLSQAEAYISNSTINSTGNVNITADNKSIIDATLLSSLSTGDTGGSGVLAFNSIGWKPQNVFANALDTLIGDPLISGALSGEQPASVKAYIRNTEVNVEGNLFVSAISEVKINATVSNAADSTASALYGASGKSAGLILASNKLSSNVEAYIDYDSVYRGKRIVNVAGELTIAAQDNAGIYANSKIVSSSTTTNDGGAALLQEGINDRLKVDFRSLEGQRTVKFGDRVRLTDDYDSELGKPGSVYEYMGTTATLDLSNENYSDKGYWKQVPETQLVPQGLNLAYGGDSDAVGVGGLVVLNDVKSNVVAYINRGEVTAGEITLKSLETSEISATADITATASGGTVMGKGNVLAASGVIATNLILSDSQAYISESNVNTGNLTLDAQNTSHINAQTLNTISSGDTGVGVTMAFNTIGWKSQKFFMFQAIDTLLGDPVIADAFNSQQPAKVHAFLFNTTVNATGDISLTATNDAQINATISNNSTSVATAFADASSKSMGFVVANNMVNTDAKAYIDYNRSNLQLNTVNATGSMTISAVDEAHIVADSTLQALSSTTNNPGLVITTLFDNILSGSYQYTTKSGQRDVKNSQIVRVDDEYTNGGDAGGFYQFVGTDAEGENLDLGTVDYSSGKWEKIPLDSAVDDALAWGNKYVGLSITGSDSMGIGGLIVRNDVRGGVESFIKQATMTVADVSVSALENATIKATDTSTVEAIGGSIIASSSSIAVNGIIANNLVLSDAKAYITGSNITTNIGGVTVDAQNTSIIDAEITSNTTSKGVSVGVTLAFNTIGWQPQNFLFNTIDTLFGSSIGTADLAEVQAYILNSSIQSAGGLTVTASSEANISANIGTSSTAIVGTLQTESSNTSVSVGAVVALNKVGTLSRAYLENTPTVRANNGSVRVEVSNTSTIDANVKAPSLAVGVGAASTNTVSVGFSAARNEILNNTEAYIKNGSVTATNGSVTVSAQQNAAIEASSIASSIAVAVSLNSGQNAIGFSGGGALAFNLIRGKANAYLDNAPVVATGTGENQGVVTISATNDGSITAKVTSLSVAVAASQGFTPGASIGASVARNLIGWNEYSQTTPNPFEVQAYALNSAITAAKGITLSATSNTFIDATVAVTSVAVGLSLQGNGLGLSAAGLEATNKIATRTNAYIDGAGTTAITAQGGNLTVKAADTSRITGDAQAVSVGASLSGGKVSGSISLGLSLASNYIDNQVTAYIKDVHATITGSVILQANTLEDQSKFNHRYDISQTKALMIGDRVKTADDKVYRFLGEAYNYTTESTTPDDLVNITAGNIIKLANDYAGGGTGGGFYQAKVNINGIDLSVEDYSNTGRWQLVTHNLAEENYNDGSRWRQETAISATSIAASVAAAVASKAGFAVSGAGATADNIILSKNNAYIDNSRIINAVNVELTSQNSASVDAMILAASGALAFGGKLGAAASVGVGVANNAITQEIQAYINNSQVTASGNLHQRAISDAVILATVFAGSFAVAGGGKVGVGLGGAGVSAENKINSKVNSYIASTATAPITVTAKEVKLIADDSSTIESFTGAASLAASFAGTAGVSLSIGVSLAQNTITSEVTAYTSNANVTTNTGALMALVKEAASIQASSIAASLAAGLAGTAGIAVSGAGARADNIITYKNNAYINRGTITSAGDITLRSENTSKIDALIVAASGAVGGGGTAGVGVSIGAAVAENKITGEVQAYINNANVTATGNLHQSAIADTDISATVAAGSFAVAAAGTAGVGLSGAGVSAENKINSKVNSYIASTVTAPITVTAKEVKLIADDSSTIESFTGAASLAASFAGAGAVSVSIGVSLARNTIKNEVLAYLQKVNLKTTNGEVALSAKETAQIKTTSVAAALAVGVSSLGVALSGAGAEGTNVVANRVGAYVVSSNVETAGVGGDVVVKADSNVNLSAVVGAAAGSLGGGLVAAAGAMGVSLARNLIGFDGVQDSTGYKNQVLAYVEGSTVTATGDVRVAATGVESVKSIAFAGAVAVAAGIGGAAAGSGAAVTNKMASRVYAYLQNTGVINLGSVEVKANSHSEVTKASAMGVAVAASVAGLSVAASLVVNEISNDIQAYIHSNAARTIESLKDITVNATAAQAHINDVDAVSASVAAGALAVSGGGINISNTVANNVTSRVTGLMTLVSGEDVSILAHEDAQVTGEAKAATAAGGAVALALGVALVKNQVRSTVESFVDNDPTRVWAASATPLSITAKNTTITANAVSHIPQTLSIGIAAAAGIGAGVTANKAISNITTVVRAFTEGVTLNALGNVEIKATGDNKVRTDAKGGALGALAAGAMIAEITLGKGNNVNEVTATLGNGSVVNGRLLTIEASGVSDLLPESIAAGAGVVTGLGASSTVTNDYSTLARIGDNTTINLKSLFVTSNLKQKVDGSADSYAVALAAGTGAVVENLVTSKTNVDIGANSNITADNLAIAAVNRLIKEAYTSDGEANLRTGSAGAGVVSVLKSSTAVGTSTNPLEAVVNIGKNTNITVKGTNANRGVFRIETLTDVSAIDKVEVDTFSGFSVAVGLSEVNAQTRSGINIDTATLENKSGDMYLTSRSNGETFVSTDIFSASAFSGVAAANAKTRVDATQQITVKDALLKGSDIYLFTGRDSFAVPNLLESSANGQITTVSFGPSFSIPDVKAKINEVNRIDISGKTIIRALEDVTLVANEGIGGRQRAQTDGSVVNISLVPFGFDVPNGADVDSSNQVNISNDVLIEAGINNKSTVQIKPVTVGGVQQLNPARLDTKLNRQGIANNQLTDAEKSDLGLDAETKYEYKALNLDSLSLSIYTGTLVRVIRGANSGGRVGHYYRYIPITDPAPDAVMLEKENYGDTQRWEHLGTSPVLTDKTVYDSDTTVKFKNSLQNKFYVVKPTELDDVTLTYASLGNLLIEQRNQVLDWMGSHGTDPEAIARYEVQLAAIDQAIADSGLIDPETGFVKEQLDLLFVNLPNIYAAPGSIFIEADGAGSKYQPLINNKKLIARSGAEIRVTNQSPFTLNVNDAIIRDNKRIKIIDGEYTVLQPGNIYFNNSPLTQVNNTSPKNISIVQDAFPNSQYDLGEITIPSADQDIYILGDVINEAGDLFIDNREGSIHVSGQIRAAAITINAARNFNLNTNGWFHTNRDPRQYLNLDITRAAVYDPWGKPDAKTYFDAGDIEGQDLQSAINENRSRILAQGLISITARYLNVNGIIQSGVTTIELDIAPDFNPGNHITNFTDDNGRTIRGISFGEDQVPVDGYFDPNQQAIILDDIIPKGGQITIAGQIFSTGNGQLRVANGYTNLDINNQSPYKLILNNIDTTTNRKGKITIIDTETLKKTEYTLDAEGIQTVNYQGVHNTVSNAIDYNLVNQVTNGVNDQIKYQPTPNKFYLWTEGQEKTGIYIFKYENRTYALTKNMIYDI